PETEMSVNMQNLRRSANLRIAVCAFLMGAAASAFVLSRSRVPAASREEETVPRQEAAHGAGDRPGLIKLDAAAIQTAGIRAEPARLTSMGETLTVPGTVEVSPNRAAKITPPVSGKIVRLSADPGDSVRAGQPLAVLDSYEVAQARAAVRQADAGVQRRRAALLTARAETDQARAGVRQGHAHPARRRGEPAGA